MRAFLLFASLSFVVEGQMSPQFGCELRVSVKSSSGQPVRATLVLIGTVPFSRTSQTDDTGQATFIRLPEDDYRLLIRLANRRQTEESVSTRNGACLQSETVRLSGPDELVSGSQVFVGDLKAPNKAKRLYEQGVSHLSRQQWRDAQRFLEKATEVYPEFAGAYNALGIAASENGDFDLANAAFRAALQLRKNYSEARMNFAKSLIRQKQFKDAGLLLNDLLSFDQTNRAAITLFAGCLFEQQKFDEVIGLVHQVHLKHYAHDVAVHRCASEIYRRRGMMQEFARENAVIAAESEIPSYDSRAPESR